MSPEQIEAHVRVPSHHLLLDLLGDSDRHLRQVEDHFPEVRFVARGDELALKGEEIAVEKARTVLGELLILVLFVVGTPRLGRRLGRLGARLSASRA